MIVTLVVLGGGYVVGFWRGAKFGRHHARGLRSWRDLLSYAQSSKGLGKRIVREWGLAIGELLLAVAFIAVLGVTLFMHR